MREQLEKEYQNPDATQEELKKERNEKIRNFLLNYSLYIVLGILILIIIILEPSFLSLQNLTNILSQASTRAIMALGVAGLIVLQGTDLCGANFRIVSCCRGFFITGSEFSV